MADYRDEEYQPPVEKVRKPRFISEERRREMSQRMKKMWASKKAEETPYDRPVPKKNPTSAAPIAKTSSRSHANEDDNDKKLAREFLDWKKRRESKSSSSQVPRYPRKQLPSDNEDDY